MRHILSQDSNFKFELDRQILPVKIHLTAARKFEGNKK